MGVKQDLFAFFYYKLYTHFINFTNFHFLQLTQYRVILSKIMFY